MISNKIKKNSGLITINYGNVDSLSFNELDSRFDLKGIEEDFNERINFSEASIAKKILPRELQSDFVIKTRKDDERLKYFIAPANKDSFSKFPLTEKIEIRFSDEAAAREFSEKGGFKQLIEEADKTQRPVKIPNLSKITEFIGEYKNPIPIIGGNNLGPPELFIMPRPLPPAQKFVIECLSRGVSFRAEANLRLMNFDRETMTLTNKESHEEKFDIKVELPGPNKAKSAAAGSDEPLPCSIRISLRNQFRNDILARKEIYKLIFLLRDTASTMFLSCAERPEIEFKFENFGKESITEERFARFEQNLALFDKLAYVARAKNICFSFNPEELPKESCAIEFLYSECQGRNYTAIGEFKNELEFNEAPKSGLNKSAIAGGNIVIDKIDNIKIFGQRVDIKPTRLVMKVCDTEWGDDARRLIVRSNKIEFISTER